MIFRGRGEESDRVGIEERCIKQEERRDQRSDRGREYLLCLNIPANLKPNSKPNSNNCQGRFMTESLSIATFTLRVDSVHVESYFAFTRLTLNFFKTFETSLKNTESRAVSLHVD